MYTETSLIPKLNLVVILSQLHEIRKHIINLNTLMLFFETWFEPL